MDEYIQSVLAIAITWLGIVLTVWIAFYTLKYQQHTSNDKEQLYKVYLPLFKMIEPHLYKQIKEIGINELENLINDIHQVCNQHYELVEPQIISYIIRIKDNLSESDLDKELADEQFMRICSKIDFEFERCRKSLGFPTRGPYYRLNHRQYRNNRELIYNLFLIKWKSCAFLFASALVAIPLANVFVGVFTKLLGE